MPEAWTFRNLDLSDVVPQRAMSGLPVGKFVCVINDAELKPSRSGMQVILYLEEVEGLGSTRDYITVHTFTNDENSKLAEQIGKQRFKAVLECAKHPNPNNPGDLTTILGLVVGVITEQAEDWIDPAGNQRRGFVRPRRNGAYVTAASLGWTGAERINTTYNPARGPAKARSEAADAAAATADLDDDIPF